MLRFSLLDTGEAALASFLSLPGVDLWNPENFLFKELSFVFDVGLPIALLGNNPSADAYKQEIGKAISRGHEVPPNLWSEVQVGALLSNWGLATSFVKRETYSTPDLEVQLENGQMLYVEVTRGEIRHPHVAVKDGLASLLEVLSAGDVDWNVVCFFADASNPDDLNAALDAAIALHPGECKEKPERWAVQAIPLECRDDVLRVEMKPDWWSSNEPSYFANGALIGGDISPIVTLRTMIPATSLYVNPIRSKAGSKQHRPGHPYLIALDTSNMLGAHRRILSELNRYFPDWKHVSGVMLFDARFWVGVNSKEWIVSLHTNPYAELPLPIEIGNITNNEPHSVKYILSNELLTKSCPNFE